MKKTIDFLSTIYTASNLGGSRYKADMFADRLLKAMSEPTLSDGCEHLLKVCNCDGKKLWEKAIIAMVGEANGPRSQMILNWLRANPKLATALAAARQDDPDVKAAIDSIVLTDENTGGVARARGGFTVGIKAEAQAPISHGSDIKAGNATIFRRINVLSTDGGVLNLPYYSGNAVRGQIRDLLADHFLRSIGLPVDRSKPSVALWFFYALYAGGALEEKSDATKALRKELGDNGSIRAEGIRNFRDMLPGLSLLGCALGNRVLPGHVQFADLRPCCAEWGNGEIPVANLMAWEFLTRREDHEDHDEHHGMIANTEVLRAGTMLEGGVDHDNAIPSIEMAALGRGLLLLKERGHLGAESRRGLGRVNIEITDCPSPDEYDKFLEAHKSEIVEYLESIKATFAPDELCLQ